MANPAGFMTGNEEKVFNVGIVHLSSKALSEHDSEHCFSKVGNDTFDWTYQNLDALFGHQVGIIGRLAHSNHCSHTILL